MKHLSILLAGSALLAILPAQATNVLLPDNHHLGESQAQVFGSGSNNWWGSTASVAGRHFQVLYDASHFTVVGGVNGPIQIRHVYFRGEDTEHNRGGQRFTNVVASLYATSLTSAGGLSTTFATNLLPVSSTLLGTMSANVITATPARGRAPNDYVIDLDFTPFLVAPYDPMVFGPGARPNFLIDVTYQTQTVGPPPELSNMMQIQDTAGGTGLVRGVGVYAASLAALSGTSSTAPPVMRIEFQGPGGYPMLLPARNERYGGACGGRPSAFYQLFAHNQYFDLRDPGQVDGLSGLRLTPNVYPNPAFYVVSGGAAPVDIANGVVGAALITAEDTTAPFPIPPFDYPGAPAGGTAQIRPSSNGYVILDPTSTETVSDFSPTVAEFLGASATNVARLCPFWHDFSPQKNLGIDPTSGLYAVISAANPAVVLVTWYRVGRYNSVAQPGQEYHTMQVSLNVLTGVVEFRYGDMDEIWGDTFTTSVTTGGTNGITGFTRGQIAGASSVDPQSRDLSIERPFRTSIEGPGSNMGNTVVAAPVGPGPVYMGRAFYGQTLTWNADSVPPGSLLGAQLLDTMATRPGLMLPFLTAPGCMLSVGGGALLWEITVMPPPNVVGTVPLMVPVAGYPGFLGTNFYAQYIVLDGLFVPGPLITVASNAVRTTVGLQ